MAAPYLLKKYEAMRNDFKTLKDEGYRSQVIIKKIATKYFMSEATVEDIVYGNGAYSTKPKEPKPDKNQLDIFSQ